MRIERVEPRGLFAEGRGMSAPRVAFQCPRCGLAARYVFAGPAGPNRVKTIGDFTGLCMADLQPARADLCPEFRSEMDRIQRFRERGYFPKGAA